MRTKAVWSSDSISSPWGAGGTPAERFIALRLRATVIEFGAAKELMQDEASYICTACGEEIVVPIDLSAGESQEYTEDCPVCCHPNVIRIEVTEDGDVQVWADKESD
jgi:DNA-directed RNA polymerase subunit RPC12/RpoP